MIDFLIACIIFIGLIYLFLAKRNPPNEPHNSQSELILDELPGLSKLEKEFFNRLDEAKKLSKLPGNFTYTKSSGGHFTVYYEESSDSCYVGKIKITTPITRYSVLKAGNNKASRIFDSENEAIEYVKQHPKFSYKITKLIEQEESFIQYSLNLDSDAKYIYSNDIQVLTSYISNWIKYVKKVSKDF